MEGIIVTITEKLAGILSSEVIAFLISMVPVLELRGGMIAAKLMEIPLLKAMWICALGNLVPVPFILLFITPIFTWLKKTKLFRPLVEKLEKRAMDKADQVERYEFWGLMLFVGIPLPMTGAWTGSLIAAMLNMRFRKAFPAVLCGICLADLIMSIVSYGVLGLLLG